MPHTASAAVAVVGVVFLLISGFFFLVDRIAGRQPYHYDGVGGEDTKNFMLGCLAPIAGMIVGGCAGLCLIVAAGLYLFGM